MARPLPKTTAPASRKKRNSGHNALQALASAAPASAKGSGDRLDIRPDRAPLAKGHRRFQPLHGHAFTSQTTTPANKTSTTGSEVVRIVVTATTRYTTHRRGSRP